MASAIVYPDCKYVVVYTDKSTTPNILKTVTLKTPSKEVIPKNIKIESITKFGTGCQLNIDCGVDIPNVVQAGCYGFQVIISDTESGSSAPAFDRLKFKSVTLNNIVYNLNTDVITSGSENLNILGDKINTTDTLKDLIVGFKSKSVQATDQGKRYIAVFSAVPYAMVGGYFTIELSGRVSSLGTMILNLPIITLEELQTLSGVNDYTCS